jgi:recombinational DNA repair protein RecT
MAKKTILKRMAKLLPKSDALSTVLKMDDETNYKEPVNVTPEKQTQPLSRLKEAMGMEQEEVDQAADNVINNYRKEE